MKRHAYLRELLPRMARFWLARAGMVEPGGPITLTFSVTNWCQSRCKTCNIWRFYADPEFAPDLYRLRRRELALDEIERIFRSMSHIYFFNISGGEPFLRGDLPEIVELAVRYLTPGIIHIPTNALAPERIEGHTRRICAILTEKAPGVPFTVKPSMDGVGVQHDEIRGVPGNFAKLLDTVDRLKRVAEEYENLHVEVGTVISRFNADDIARIADFGHSLGVQSYRHEIAENREEFRNLEDRIVPTPEQYRRAIRFFKKRTRAHLAGKRSLGRMTESLRLVYYDYAARIHATGRQVLPCYAGITNVHLTPYGELWPCCTLGDRKPLGNLREAGHDFQRVWRSKQARRVRRSIACGECACPLANQAYSNILMHPLAAIRVAWNLVALRLGLMPRSPAAETAGRRTG